MVEARTGMRTFEWLRSLGFYGENTWYAHCWEETDEEFKIMGAAGVGAFAAGSAIAKKNAAEVAMATASIMEQEKKELTADGQWGYVNANYIAI